MKRKLTAILMCLVLASTVACGSDKTKEPDTNTKKTETTKEIKETKTEEETTEVNWTLEQVKTIPEIISGIDNVTAEQSTEHLDLTSLVTYDKTIVTNIAINDTDADYNAPATYNATYKVTMNTKKYEKYINEHDIKDLTVACKTKTFVANIPVTVTIIAPETAQELKEQGQTVASVETTGTVKPEKTQANNHSGSSGNENNNAGGTSNTNNNGNTSSNDNNNNNGNTHSGGSNNNPNNGNTPNNNSNTNAGNTPSPSPSTPTPPTTPSACVHNVVAHWATRVIQEAWTETVTKEVTVNEDHVVDDADPSRDLTVEWKNRRPDLPNIMEYIIYLTETEGYQQNCHHVQIPVTKTVTETIQHDAVTEEYIDYYYCLNCGERIEQ